MGKLPQKLMPVADRNQFAIEIYLSTGTAVERTAVVADSLENVLRKDARVVSVTSFIGCSSPRFHTAYAPQIGGTNYSQLIVNTLGNEETVELLDEYSAKYTNAFPEARVRFKQISPTLTLQRKISLFSMFFVSETADNQFCVCR